MSTFLSLEPTTTSFRTSGKRPGSEFVIPYTKQLAEPELKKVAGHHESARDWSMCKSTFAFLIQWKYSESK
jgi:hypothetical protein